MNFSNEKAHAILARCLGANSFRMGLAREESAAKRGGTIHNRCEKDHAMDARANGSLAERFFTAARERALKRGSCSKARAATDQAKAARSPNMYSVSVRRDAAAIECLSGRSQNNRFAKADAICAMC